MREKTDKQHTKTMNAYGEKVCEICLLTLFTFMLVDWCAHAVTEVYTDEEWWKPIAVFCYVFETQKPQMEENKNRT